MKTILHIIDTTGPGGAETVFLELAKATDNCGYKSLALIQGPGWVLSELERLNLRHFVFNCKGSVNFKYLINLIQLIRSEKVDLIQTHLFGSAVYACIAGIVCRKPVFCTLHGLVDIAADERFEKIKLLALRLGSTKIITVTDRLSSFIKSRPLLNSERVTTIYNGIHISDYEKAENKSLRIKLGIGDHWLVGSVGNMRVPKNYPLAIETIHLLHKNGIKAHYAIAGQGNETQLQPVISLIEKYDLADYVHILGFVSDIRGFLSCLDIFLMSSSSEGHPLALTQAMINGCPIVTTPSGIEETVTNGVDALIAPQHDAESLARLIKQLYYDSSLAQKLSENAREKAKKLFAIQAMLNHYLTLYKNET